MKWIVFSKRIPLTLIAALIMTLPAFSPSADSAGTFSFNLQGPISPPGELAEGVFQPLNLMKYSKGGSDEKGYSIPVVALFFHWMAVCGLSTIRVQRFPGPICLSNDLA